MGLDKEIEKPKEREQEWRCDACLYGWFEFHAPIQCRKEPPVVIMARDGIVDSFYPEVPGDSFCSHFKVDG